MALKSLMSRDQDKTISTSEQFLRLAIQPEYAPVREILCSVGFDVDPFLDHLRDATHRARRSFLDRTRYQTRTLTETDDVAAWSRRVGDWLDVLERALVALSRDPDPQLVREASHFLRMLRARSLADTSGQEGDRARMMVVVNDLETSAVGAHPALPPGFIEQGRELLASFEGEDGDRRGAMAAAQFEGPRLHGALDEILELFERLHAVYALAEARVGHELPGLEFTLLRGAVAPRRRASEVEEEPLGGGIAVDPSGALDASGLPGT